MDEDLLEFALSSKNRLSKRVSFADVKHIREFIPGEKEQRWGDTYEQEVTSSSASSLELTETLPSTIVIPGQEFSTNMDLDESQENTILGGTSIYLASDKVEANNFSNKLNCLSTRYFSASELPNQQLRGRYDSCQSDSKFIKQEKFIMCNNEVMSCMSSDLIEDQTNNVQTDVELTSIQNCTGETFGSIDMNTTEIDNDGVIFIPLSKEMDLKECHSHISEQIAYKSHTQMDNQTNNMQADLELTAIQCCTDKTNFYCANMNTSNIENVYDNIQPIPVHINKTCHIEKQMEFTSVFDILRKSKDKNKCSCPSLETEDINNSCHTEKQMELTSVIDILSKTKDENKGSNPILETVHINKTCLTEKQMEFTSVIDVLRKVKHENKCSLSILETDDINNSCHTEKQMEFTSVIDIINRSKDENIGSRPILETVDINNTSHTEKQMEFTSVIDVSSQAKDENQCSILEAENAHTSYTFSKPIINSEQFSPPFTGKSSIDMDMTNMIEQSCKSDGHLMNKIKNLNCDVISNSNNITDVRLINLVSDMNTKNLNEENMCLTLVDNSISRFTRNKILRDSTNIMSMNTEVNQNILPIMKVKSLCNTEIKNTDQCEKSFESNNNTGIVTQSFDFTDLPENNFVVEQFYENNDCKENISADKNKSNTHLEVSVNALNKIIKKQKADCNSSDMMVKNVPNTFNNQGLTKEDILNESTRSVICNNEFIEQIDINIVTSNAETINNDLLKNLSVIHDSTINKEIYNNEKLTCNSASFQEVNPVSVDYLKSPEFDVKLKSILDPNNIVTCNNTNSKQIKHSLPRSQENLSKNRVSDVLLELDKEQDFKYHQNEIDISLSSKKDIQIENYFENLSSSLANKTQHLNLENEPNESTFLQLYNKLLADSSVRNLDNTKLNKTHVDNKIIDKNCKILTVNESSVERLMEDRVNDMIRDNDSSYKMKRESVDDTNRSVDSFCNINSDDESIFILSLNNSSELDFAEINCDVNSNGIKSNNTIRPIDDEIFQTSKLFESNSVELECKKTYSCEKVSNCLSDFQRNCNLCHDEKYETTKIIVNRTAFSRNFNDENLSLTLTSKPFYVNMEFYLYGSHFIIKKATYFPHCQDLKKASAILAMKTYHNRLNDVVTNLIGTKLCELKHQFKPVAQIFNSLMDFLMQLYLVENCYPTEYFDNKIEVTIYFASIQTLLKLEFLVKPPNEEIPCKHIISCVPNVIYGNNSKKKALIHAIAKCDAEQNYLWSVITVVRVIMGDNIR